jgi:hypothetical protein
MQGRIYLHTHPVWRDRADSVIYVKDADPSVPGRYYLEQLWARRLEDNHFEICCIPLYVYGLALGDVVAARPEKSQLEIAYEFIKPSGQYTLRVWFGDSSDPQAQEEVPRELEQLGCLLEWGRKHLLAVSVTEHQEREVRRLLDQRESLGHLDYETGWGDRPEVEPPETIPEFPEDIVMHFYPVWQERADMLLFATLEPERHALELLWGRQLEGHEFEICCIPFYVSGLALGDVVATEPGDEQPNRIHRVVKPSGHVTFYIRLDSSATPDVQERIVSELAEQSCWLEWVGPQLLAVSAPMQAQAQSAMQLLSQERERGHVSYY